MEDLEDQRSNLSNDVMMDILKRMVAISLIRLKCVSKTWYSLINSLDFASAQYNYDSISKYIVLLKRYCVPKEENEDDDIIRESIYYNGINTLSFHSNNESFKCIAPNVEYNLDNYIGVDIVGPCNGIFCIASYRTICLCNPTLKEFWELPAGIVPISPRLYSSYDKTFSFWMQVKIGIGFDCNINNYKVVRIQNNNHTYQNEKFVYVSKVDIYNLSTNRWRKLEDLQSIVKSFQFSPVLFNGAFHWDGSTEATDEHLVSFNFSTESFNQIPYPEGLAQERKGTSLSILNKTLALICFTKSYYPEENAFHQLIDIWVMKIYGVGETWIKKFIVGPLLIYAPLIIWLNDTELMIENYDGKLMSCNIFSQETKNLDISGGIDTLKAIVYKESLFSIKKEREKLSS